MEKIPFSALFPLNNKIEVLRGMKYKTSRESNISLLCSTRPY